MFDLSRLVALAEKVPEVVAQGEAFIAAHKGLVDGVAAAAADASRPLTKDEVFAEVGRLLDLAKTL